MDFSWILKRIHSRSLDYCSRHFSHSVGALSDNSYFASILPYLYVHSLYQLHALQCRLFKQKSYIPIEQVSLLEKKVEKFIEFDSPSTASQSFSSHQSFNWTENCEIRIQKATGAFFQIKPNISNKSRISTKLHAYAG